MLLITSIQLRLQWYIFQKIKFYCVTSYYHRVIAKSLSLSREIIKTMVKSELIKLSSVLCVKRVLVIIQSYHFSRNKYISLQSLLIDSFLRWVWIDCNTIRFNVWEKVVSYIDHITFTCRWSNWNMFGLSNICPFCINNSLLVCGGIHDSWRCLLLYSTPFISIRIRKRYFNHSIY